MPSITTHYIFAKDVHKKMSEENQMLVDKAFDFYSAFSQSFDSFYYYRIIFRKTNKRVKKMGHIWHHRNTQAYLINIVKNMIKNKAVKDPECLAYLFGSINHYCLDSICHPYVFYKTGVPSKEDRQKYLGLHTKMEFDIDAYLFHLKEEGEYRKFKFKNHLTPKLKFDTNLVKVIDDTFKQTYNKENISRLYEKSIWWARFIYRIGAYDPYGWKKFLYKIFDKLARNRNGHLQHVSFYKKDNYDYWINIDKKTWNHPSDINLKFNYSFLELYDLALEKATTIIEKVTQVLNNEADIKILSKYIENVSYGTGLDLSNENKPLKYFEF